MYEKLFSYSPGRPSNPEMEIYLEDDVVRLLKERWKDESVKKADLKPLSPYEVRMILLRARTHWLKEEMLKAYARVYLEKERQLRREGIFFNPLRAV